MSKSDIKARILYIYKLLLQETDMEHSITIQQIINSLELQVISAYRKTVISDIEQLKDFGVDIVGVRSSQNKYYMRSSLTLRKLARSSGSTMFSLNRCLWTEQRYMFSMCLIL